MKKLFITFSLFLLSSVTFAQLNENFESGVIPSNWAVFKNGPGPAAVMWNVITNSNSCGGNSSAYMNANHGIGIGNTSENWMVTNLVNVPANGELKFLSRASAIGDNGAIFQIKISTSSQTNVNTFTLLKQWSDYHFGNLTEACKNEAIDLSSYAGQQIYIAFITKVTQPTISPSGDRWIVDNIRLVQKCKTPIGFQFLELGATTGTINWNELNNATQWEIQVKRVTELPPTNNDNGTVIASKPYQITNLTPNVEYKLYLRSVCQPNNFSDWSEPYYFVPGCVGVTGVSFAITGIDALVTWNNIPGNAGYEVEFLPTDQDFLGSGVVVNTNSHVFHNIDAKKIYHAKVRSMCRGNDGQLYTGDWSDFPVRCLAAQFQINQVFIDSKDLCTNKPSTFEVAQDARFTYKWSIFDSNDNLVTILNGPVPTFSFSQLGNYYCILEATSQGCNEKIRKDFEIKECPNEAKCIIGNITSANILCSEENANNYVTFSPDSSTPINYSDPNINFLWSVTDSNGNPVFFEPVYLFGSTLATYIRIPFSEGAGDYTIDLTIEISKCKESFQKIVNVAKGCKCKIEGDIKIKEDKACVGNQFSLNFNSPQPGYTYTWNILNSNYQSVYYVSGYQDSISAVINQTGEFIVLLSISMDKERCDSFFIYHLNVENCGDRCLLGDIKNSNLCVDGNNYFWFVPDTSTPIDYSDQNLLFEWYVADSDGNSVSFEPIYLFGSNLPYYIRVPFQSEGAYSVELAVTNSKCSEKIKNFVNVNRCDCKIEGNIKIKEDKICKGKDINLYFNSPQPGYIYSWNILNSQYQSVYSNSSSQEGITTIINQAGEYVAVLSIKDAKGCESIQIFTFSVEDCGSGGAGDCIYHFAFSFSTPNDVMLNNNSRLTIGRCITDFVNQNASEKLFITSVDDHQNGSRFGAKQSSMATTWNLPIINSSNEINGFSSVGNLMRIRIQNDNYPNTISKVLSFVSNTEDITIPINMNFVIASSDSNTSELINSYNNLLASGKVEKIFFILFEGGQYNFNGQNLSPQNFLSQVITNPVNYSQTNNVTNSNYIIIPNSISQTVTLRSYLNAFFQKAYDDLKIKIKCDDNCLKGEIKNETSLCAGADNSFWFNPTGPIDFTEPGLNFAWTVTQNGNPVPFNAINANNAAINLPNAVAGSYNITLVVSNNNCTKTYIKNVTITNCNVGSCSNPTNQYYVAGLFRNLLNHLKNQPASAIINGYNCAEMMSLLPYVNPSIVAPAIYNFTNTNNTISFSFSANASTPHVVFKMPANNPNSFVTLSLGTNYLNMNSQTAFISNFFIFTPFPTSVFTSGSSVSQVNFCPNELNCLNHIAIVLDESTSITSVDAGRIRSHLKKFIDQQVIFNQTKGSQLRLTLIGLSDQDNNERTDEIINVLVNPANKQRFINWINKYKTRYNSLNNSGISSNSDYWNSGLYKAAQTNASLVILITDGAQTANLATLKSTIDLYDNGGNVNSEKHLHVIGLNDGFYVNGVTNSGRYSDSFNPNLLNETLIEEEDEAEIANVENNIEASRITNSLQLSLRYLIYENVEFPSQSVIGLENPFSADYSGHTNFKFLYDDPYYLSNGLYDFLGKTCGTSQYLEKCDNCDGVQLEPRQSYIISGWVHVDKTQQVTSFREANQTPSIEIQFSNQGGFPLVFDPAEADYLTKYEFFPQGNIIDGWQRIFGAFKVHPETFYLEIILKNGSVTDAIHFDDIRVHPQNGSMKSFIYDEQNYKLMSELDENNYSTYYEYDAEGGLVRVKKETERGVKTIQETRSGSTIKSE